MVLEKQSAAVRAQLAYVRDLTTGKPGAANHQVQSQAAHPRSLVVADDAAQERPKRTLSALGIHPAAVLTLGGVAR
jgi:hypothetical protein